MGLRENMSQETILKILSEKKTMLTAKEISTICDISRGAIDKNLKQMRKYNIVLAIKFAQKGKPQLHYSLPQFSQNIHTGVIQ
jgi:response regulator of citrate/malate metabolism